LKAACCLLFLKEIDWYLWQLVIDYCAFEQFQNVLLTFLKLNFENGSFISLVVLFLYLKNLLKPY